MQVLTGHTSQDTAYVVNDYPYGFRLRCKIRYWLEYKKGKGFRFCSQTTDPRKPGDWWNKPKCSTYRSLGGVMLMDTDNGHISWDGLNEYCELEQAREFFDSFGHTMPEEARLYLQKLIDVKVVYGRLKAEGVPFQEAGIRAVAEYHHIKLDK